ncbi:MgtC/SapB family protein [Rubeoparvulum massiliense]|uniref:MgtC/SapB family protein n=1 Tax=Rubeoparvulum massiliense TaxID=1631346 RepID=UPI0009769A7C|nr:MgtC/SapB family protein [Rubeoparvulum massiliense]
MIENIDTITMLGRLILAAILGGLIGWERDLRNKQAGLKTNLLVSVGSALVMMLSTYGFLDVENHPNARFDPTRLAHGVISGIGFLGAGAILRQANHIVTGLTTAAMLWVVAAIGLCVGAGYYTPAIVTTLLVLFSVSILGEIEGRFLVPKKLSELWIVMDDRPGLIHQILKIVREHGMDVQHLTVSDHDLLEEGRLGVGIRGRYSARFDWANVTAQLKMVAGVKHVECEMPILSYSGKERE